MFNYQKVGSYNAMLYTGGDSFMWIDVNNRQLRVYGFKTVYNDNFFTKLYTYCPHDVCNSKGIDI